MAFQWWFNGTDMSQFLETNDVVRNIGQDRKATLQKIGTADGKKFQYTSADEGKITVSFLLRRDMVSKRRQIAGLLATEEPAQLIFGDEKDKYYLAIADDQTTLTEKFRHGNGEITFVVPDGLAHAVDMKAAVSGQSGTDLTVLNGGTAPTAPVLTATMSADNGLVAFVNDQGAVLQFGDPEEIDGVTSKRAETPLHPGFDSDPGGSDNTGVSNYPNYGNVDGQANVRSGSMKYGVKYVGASAMVPAFGDKSDYWNGPSKVIPIPKNSAGLNTGNIVTYTRFYFDTSRAQMGRLEFTLSGNGAIVFESVLRDSMIAGDEMQWEVFYRNQLLATTSLNRKTFKNGGLYELRMWRFSQTFSFQLARVGGVNADNTVKAVSPVVKAYSIVSREPIDSFGVWFERWQNKKAVNFGVTDFKSSWTDVEYWTNYANRFSAGDVVQADVANKQILVNGVVDNTLHTVGNMWDAFLLQPGKNTVQGVASSWADPFDIEVEYREAWY